MTVIHACFFARELTWYGPVTPCTQIKMAATGKVFFIDLDSTNGTRIDGVELEAHEPYELTLSKPIKVEVGAGEYEFTFE
jgi:pSer/pThr/pTyr-binding forkhead associated (FHA) protein